RPDIVSTPNSNIVAHNLSVLSHVRPTGSTTNGGGGLSEGVILGSGQVQHCEFSLDPAGRLVGAVRWVDHSLRDSTYSQGTATDTMVKASIVFWGYGGSAVILDYQTRGNLTHTQRANWGGTFAAQEAIRSAFIAENPYALEVINRTPQALLPEDIVDALHLGIEALSVYSFSKKWQQKERHLLLLNVGDQVRIIRVFAEGEIQTRARRVYLLGSGLKVLAGLRVVITKQTPHVYKDTPDPTPPLQLRLILPKGFTHYDLIMPIFELVQRKLVSTHLQVKGWESATSAYASNVQIEFTDDNLIPANHVDADGNYRSSPYRNSNGE
ncbi:MAG TPA: hypothetical protein VJC18_01645, partial [bacterium]|nr:hypothetical protein [bacterium]